MQFDYAYKINLNAVLKRYKFNKVITLDRALRLAGAGAGAGAG